MAASYPSAIKTFTTKVVNDVIQAAHVNDLQDEVTAVETGLVTAIQHDLKFTDATYDIGKTGATRPRDLFLSRNATIGGTLAVTGNVVSNLIFTDATYDIGATGATRPRDIHLSRDLVAGDQLFERARSVAVGEWTAVAFSAGNFTGNGSMTWTVAEADQVTFAYTLIGKTMIVSLYLATTTVGGTPNTYLAVTIPQTVGTRTMMGAYHYRDNGTMGTGMWRAFADSTILAFYLSDFGASWAAATDTTEIRALCTFEIA